LPAFSVNQTASSGPRVMPAGWLPAVMPLPNAWRNPPTVRRPIRSSPPSVKYRALSGPTVTSLGAAPTGSVKSVMDPAVVMRPILSFASSVNHSAPSGPVTMFSGSLLGTDRGNSSVTAPAVVMRPISPEPASVNQSAPSGPLVMPAGPLPAPGTANSVTAPLARVRRATESMLNSVNHRLPSGPTVMLVGPLPTVMPVVNVSVNEAWMAASLPASGLMRPILSVNRSVK